MTTLTSLLIFAKPGDAFDVALGAIFLAVVVVVCLIAAALRGPARYDLLIKDGLPYCPRCNRQVSYRRDYCRACGYTFKTYGYEQESQEAVYAHEAIYAAWRKQEDEHLEAMREWDQKRARAKAEREARAEEKRRARRELYESKGIDPDGSFRWLGLLYQGYQGLPDWQQAIVLGLALAAPAVVLLALLMR